MDLSRIDSYNYRVTPSRRILTPNYRNNLNVLISNLNQNDYTVTTRDEGDNVAFRIDSNRDIVDRQLQLNTQGSNIYDLNRNLVDQNQQSNQVLSLTTLCFDDSDFVK